MQVDKRNWQMAKILIIDDDARLCQVLGEFLGDNGHEVTIALDGARGMNAARKNSPDLILCDLEMPGMTGQEVVVMMRQDDRLEETPVIYLSGCTDPERIRQSINVGGDDFIGKPAPYPVILDAVEARLRRQEQAQQRQRRRLKQTVEVVTNLVFDLDVDGGAAAEKSGKTPLAAGLSAEIVEQLRSTFGPALAASRPAADKSGPALLIKEGGRQQFLKISEVKAFLAFGEYSKVYWGGKGENVMFRKALKQWQQELPAGQFVRVHRNAIVNLAFLDRVETDAAQKQCVHLRGFGQVLQVSQRAKATLNRCLKEFTGNPKGKI